MEDLIDARIRKYSRDIEAHRAPSQPDGVCRCGSCNIDRAILTELMYMKMAHRMVSSRANAMSNRKRSPAPRGTPYAFILAHVDYQGDGCLTWPFSRDQHGRGHLKVDDKGWWAHRLMCTLAHGDPPTPKHTAAHSCGKGHEGCIHPQHLSWKTQKENLADCALHGTAARTWYGRGGILKPDQVQEIREARGIKTQLALSRQFGVSEGAINDIWRGRTHSKPFVRPLWNEGEDAMLKEALSAGMSFREASVHIGTKSLPAVTMRAYRLGLKSGRPPTRDYYGDRG
jgi:hypothetical protein